MTVKELIQALQEFPENAVVWKAYADGSYAHVDTLFTVYAETTRVQTAYSCTDPYPGAIPPPPPVPRYRVVVA